MRIDTVRPDKRKLRFAERREFMAEVNESRKETPRIGLPPPPRPPIKRPAMLPGLGQPPASQMPAPIREPASPLEDSPVFAIPVPPSPRAPTPTLLPVPPAPAATPAPVAPSAPPAVVVPPPPPAPPLKPAIAVFPAHAIPMLGPNPPAKNETARIATLPEPRKAAPAVKMAKTQPLIPVPPSAVAEPARPTAPSEISSPLDFVPLPVCWGALGLSALICLTQLWTYFT